MKITYSPAVAGILRQQRNRRLKALAKGMALLVAYVAILCIWLGLG